MCFIRGLIEHRNVWMKTPKYDCWSYFRITIQPIVKFNFAFVLQIILVEGPIAAGKTDFAKKLADELDMYYLPQASMDDVYINEYGYDMRELDSKLPPGAQSFDEKKFLNDPKNRLTSVLQMNMFGLKWVANDKIYDSQSKLTQIGIRRLYFVDSMIILMLLHIYSPPVKVLCLNDLPIQTLYFWKHYTSIIW